MKVSRIGQNSQIGACTILPPLVTPYATDRAVKFGGNAT